MPGAVFVRVLQMSLTGCYSIGIVLAVRLLLKRCGRTCTYYLWVLMFAGLCLPVSMPGHYSLIPRQVAEFSLAEVMMKEEPAEDPGGEKDALRYLEEQEDSRQPVMLHRLPPAGISSGQLQDAAGGRTSAEASAVWNASGVQEEYRKETDAFKPRPAGWDRMAYLVFAEKIWLLGIFVFLLYQLFSIYRMSRRCRGYGQPVRTEDGWIVEAEGVPSPFLWGLFRPVIYLPSGLKGEERTYILAHEMVHRNRRDYLVRPLILAFTMLHWFNPLVWFACAMCFKDMEISCDEAVLGNSAVSLRKSYAESLLKYAAGQNRFLISPLGFGEPSVKFRIRNVLRFRKKNVWISAAAGLCVIGVAAGLWHHPSGETALPDESVQEAEPLPEGEEPEVDAEEGLVVNNGGEVVRVAGAYYYMDGMPLYSDGEALYASVEDDDKTWHVCRYERDGSGFRRLFDGRIVDSTEYGQVLYCMLPSENGAETYLGWYDTRTEETGRFSREGVTYLGKYDGFLYTSRQAADGFHIDRIREIDRTEETDLIKEGIPGKEILKFYADEGGKRLVFAVRKSEEYGENMEILCGSYGLESGELLSKELTGLPYFAMMDGYICFQRYKSREDHTRELFRTDDAFGGEEQVGEGLTLLYAEEETNSLLAGKDTEYPDFGHVDSLVRVWPDQNEEQVLLDMEQMLPALWGGDHAGDAGLDIALDWEFLPGDRVAYSELNRFEDLLYVTVSHMRSQEDGSLENLEKVHLTINDQGGIGLWFPDQLTPGYEDSSWYMESMVGEPVGMEAAGWDLENVTDVRENMQELSMDPDTSEKKRTYLLGETRYWTLYGKGDCRSMLLVRNGRYTEINYPYLSGRRIYPKLMEADLDNDGITELAVRLNIKHGTGCSVDSLLVADFQNNGAWVYQFPDMDFTGQLMAHLTGERTEHGLQAYIDKEPAGAPVEDEEGGRSFQSVSVGQLVDFSFDETEGKIRIRAELEFWDRDAPAVAGYNGCAIAADVVWTGEEFILRNTECLELEK